MGDSGRVSPSVTFQTSQAPTPSIPGPMRRYIPLIVAGLTGIVSGLHIFKPMFAPKDEVNNSVNSKESEKTS